MPSNYPEQEIIDWSNERNLLPTTTIEKQIVKFYEESGELCAAVCRGNKNDACDALGDMHVVMVQMAALIGVNLADCAWGAYREISDRKGKMVDGMFIKDADL